MNKEMGWQYGGKKVNRIIRIRGGANAIVRLHFQPAKTVGASANRAGQGIRAAESDARLGSRLARLHRLCGLQLVRRKASVHPKLGRELHK